MEQISREEWYAIKHKYKRIRAPLQSRGTCDGCALRLPDDNYTTCLVDISVGEKCMDEDNHEYIYKKSIINILKKL